MAPDHEALTEAIQQLWDRSNRPSTRTIARTVDGALTHTTVANILNGKTLTLWSSLRLVITALGGQPDDYYDLWRQARRERSRLREENPRSPRPKILRGIVIHPGDTVVFTTPETVTEEEMQATHAWLEESLPHATVRMVFGMDMAVLRAEEDPDGVRAG